ncbi:hypothetical protein [Bradyrhizobium amphicarpaeae]|uniref:hypothetical protein n=1 Tax=Bradyrhizobium amphicarpaeae TaxID=1404768 RepID=UPI0011E4D6C4|nr:hypothetical protein [Bradyrhizobium amphicarpaeae]
MGTAAITMTHHVARAPHITVNPAQAAAILNEIFRGLEPCDLLELSSRSRSSTAGSSISATESFFQRVIRHPATDEEARENFILVHTDCAPEGSIE